MDKKRILIIILFLAVTAGLAYLLYRVFFAPPAAPKEPTTSLPGTQVQFPEVAETGGGARPTVTTTTGLPPIGTVPGTSGGQLLSENIKQTIESPILGPAVDLNGQTKFYNQSDGKFYRLTSNGTVEALSDQVFFDVKAVTWSPTKNESIIEYPDGSNIYYNFDTKSQVSLPKHWEDFSFSDAGDKIAAKSIGLSADNRWLVTADPTGSSVTLVEPMGDNADKVIVDWSPGKQVIALSRTGAPQSGDEQEVLLVGQHGENFKSIIVEGRDLRTQWSPSGTKLLHSVYSARSDFKPELWIVNASGDAIGTGRKFLNLNTWADKCAFADDRFVYCAAPITLPTGAGFAPDVANATRDELFRIDTQTGARVQIPLDQFHVIDSVFLAPDGHTLSFTDVNEPGLFQVAI